MVDNDIIIHNDARVSRVLLKTTLLTAAHVREIYKYSSYLKYVLFVKVFLRSKPKSLRYE